MRKAESWAPGAGSAVSDIMAARETAAHLVTEFAGRARAFVQVQQGCDHRCTFCIIPFGRGPSRSVPIGAVVDQVRTLVQAGYREVVLTGVDITSYGPDLPGAPSLGQMVRRLLALVPELPRLRLSSLDPNEIDADLWRLGSGAEADEAPASARRRADGDRPRAFAAPGHRHRRRPDRRLSHRDRGAVH
jgi:threonylcarbamoyladenosine tRNA methylthiotransferase MtaB